MRKLSLAAVLVLMASGAQASSYQLTDGTVVDPIQTSFYAGGGGHLYSGPNLQPFANLNSADLAHATYLGATIGIPYCDAHTNFTNAYSGAYGSSPRNVRTH